MGNPIIEIDLSGLEDWYLTQLENIYSKHHKILGKLFKKAGNEVAQIKTALKNWTNRKPADDEEKIDEKTKRIMQRFLQSVDESLDKIEIPTYHSKISYVNSRKFVEGVQRSYQTYNAEGKKALKRFWKSFQLEIKEVDLHLRKLGEYSTKINQFLLRKYTEGKEAESLLKNIPQLEHYIERLGQSKVKIDGMDKEFENMQEFLKNQEEELFELSKNADIQKLERLEQQNMRLDRDFRNQLAVDTLALMEKPLAQRAGLGFQGKNSLIINPKFGSWIFLGELLTELSLSPDEPMENQCQDCTACIDACPTGALSEPGILDARKCLSYLTIEQKGDISARIIEMANKENVCIYGCDICQEVCPFNRDTPKSKEEQFHPRAEILNLNIKQLRSLTEPQFKRLFSDTPLARLSYQKLQRNVELLR